MTAFDYHYRLWRKSIIEEYMRQNSEGSFDPAMFASWMEAQPCIGEPSVAREASAADAREPVIRVAPQDDVV